MQKTLQALITATEKLLHQAAGPSVQMYAQGNLQQNLQMAFEHCYRHKFWPQFRKREVRALDGVTGHVTAPFTYIKSWDDIQHVFRRGSDRPLPQLPASYNTLDMPTSDTARFIEATGDDYLFTVYPVAATSNIVVIGRQTFVNEFALTDVVPFDSQVLEHFAAWSYFVDDGMNPAAALKHQGLYESRMKHLENDAASHAIVLNPQSGYIPDRWYER